LEVEDEVRGGADENKDAESSSDGLLSEHVEPKQTAVMFRLYGPHAMELFMTGHLIEAPRALTRVTGTGPLRWDCCRTPMNSESWWMAFDRRIQWRSFGKSARGVEWCLMGSIYFSESQNLPPLIPTKFWARAFFRNFVFKVGGRLAKVSVCLCLRWVGRGRNLK
jgi:hypothetical protein